MKNETKESFIKRGGAGRCSKANKRGCEADGRTGGHRVWTDGAGPTSSISWLQGGMAGKMQQNFKRQEGNVQSFQKKINKSKRKIQKHEEKSNLQQKEMSSLSY